MPFALTPDASPPRLLRFTNTIAGDVLAVLDAEENILHIDEAKFSALTASDQHTLIRSQHHITCLRNGKMIPPLPSELAA